MPVEPTAASLGRAAREIEHGRLLASDDPEYVWGWGTPAGRLRVARRAALIARGAQLGPGVRALEIGCGAGTFTELFAGTGASLVAVDISDELLARARARLHTSRVHFVCGRFEDLPDTWRFDAAIGSSVLHHLDLEPALARIRALVKPGGIVSFTEPNMLNPQVFLERHARFVRVFSYVSPDETAFVRWRLARMLARHGFDDITITPFDWLHPFTPASLIAFTTGLGAVLERLPVAREFAGSIYIRFRTPSR